MFSDPADLNRTHSESVQFPSTDMDCNTARHARSTRYNYKHCPATFCHTSQRLGLETRLERLNRLNFVRKAVKLPVPLLR